MCYTNKTIKQIKQFKRITYSYMSALNVKFLQIQWEAFNPSGSVCERYGRTSRHIVTAKERMNEPEQIKSFHLTVQSENPFKFNTMNVKS